jgi:molecular chaperone DnaJ
MAEKDFYEILGVSRDADEKEIKRAYRKKARELHPDVNKDDPDAERKFKELSEAYEILSEPDKRARYDRYGHEGINDNDFNFDDFARGGFGGFEDIFDMFFGGGMGQQRGPRRGNDLQYRMEISFEEAAFGAKKEITIPRTETCPTCHGIGAKPGTQTKTCPKCHGTGQIRISQQTAFGQFTQTRICDRCGGEGRIVDTPCPDCNGLGRIRKQRKITVNIPAGVDNGTKLRMPGEGEAGERGASSGDLYIVLNVRSHKIFKRNNDDIYCPVPINFVQAILGDEIEVPTLEGKVKLTIPEGTQPGATFRLKNKGIAHLNGYGRGDEYIKIKVIIPKSLNKEQKELLYKFAELSGDEINPEEKSWLKKVREAFRV